VDHLEKASLFQWTETDPVSKTLGFKKARTMDNVQNINIHSVNIFSLTHSLNSYPCKRLQKNKTKRQTVNEEFLRGCEKKIISLLMRHHICV
jgi:hypothetical protein